THRVNSNRSMLPRSWRPNGGVWPPPELQFDEANGLWLPAGRINRLDAAPRRLPGTNRSSPRQNRQSQALNLKSTHAARHRDMQIDSGRIDARRPALHFRATDWLSDALRLV